VLHPAPPAATKSVATLPPDLFEYFRRGISDILPHFATQTTKLREVENKRKNVRVIKKIHRRFLTK
jgi:hypothetical protein